MSNIRLVSRKLISLSILRLLGVLTLVHRSPGSSGCSRHLLKVVRLSKGGVEGPREKKRRTLERDGVPLCRPCHVFT